MSQLASFLVKIAPALARFGRALFDLHMGDADAAIAEIKDRSEEVKRRRAENDAALEKKYPEG